MPPMPPKEKQTVTPPLVCSEAMDEHEATRHLFALTTQQDRPAVLRVIRPRGIREALKLKHGRREACLPLRADEWAQILGAPFDRSGESCIKLKYADGQQRVMPVSHYIWESMGMDRIRLQYVDKADDLQ